MADAVHTGCVDRSCISCLPPHASTRLAAVRGHGSNANSMPWVLDVAWREDDGCIRRDQDPQNMARPESPRCRIALHVRKQEKTAQVGWDQYNLFKLLEILRQGH